jgi:hypothetical protein
MRKLPSAAAATSVTGPLCPLKRSTQSPISMSHTRAVESAETASASIHFQVQQRLTGHWHTFQSSALHDAALIPPLICPSETRLGAAEASIAELKAMPGTLTGDDIDAAWRQQHFGDSTSVASQGHTL